MKLSIFFYLIPELADFMLKNFQFNNKSMQQNCFPLYERKMRKNLAQIRKKFG